MSQDKRKEPRQMTKDEYIEWLQDEIRNLILTAEESEQEIASLQSDLAESHDLNTAQAKKISELQNQLTEAQGKRGKVVSRDEIANLIMFGFNSQPWSLVSTFENSGEVVNIATAIHKAVYGEGEDAVS
jgi:uncharacterized protein YfdQ (DUF2303 family)